MHECLLNRLIHVRLFATLSTVAHQAPLSMRFSRQEYWNGLPFPPPGDLPDPGIEPTSPALQADFLPSESPGKPFNARGPGSMPGPGTMRVKLKTKEGLTEPGNSQAPLSLRLSCVNKLSANPNRRKCKERRAPAPILPWHCDSAWLARLRGSLVSLLVFLLCD